MDPIQAQCCNKLCPAQAHLTDRQSLQRTFYWTGLTYPKKKDGELSAKENLVSAHFEPTKKATVCDGIESSQIEMSYFMVKIIFLKSMKGYGGLIPVRVKIKEEN